MGCAESSSHDGAGSTESDCTPYSRVSSTIHGEGFDAWEGATVQGTLFPTQTVGPPGHDDTVIANGKFELTASVCSVPSGWTVNVDHARTCFSNVDVMTPENCSCYGSISGGTDCPAERDGATDAQSDAPTETLLDATPVEGGE